MVMAFFDGFVTGEPYTLPECGFSAPEHMQFVGWLFILDVIGLIFFITKMKKDQDEEDNLE